LVAGFVVRYGAVNRQSDVQRLRKQSEKARRLAASVTDRISQNALMHYADECDEHAAKLELIEEAERRRR